MEAGGPAAAGCSAAMAETIAENVVFHHSPDLPGGGDWHGREGFQGWNQKMSEPNETVRVEDPRYFPDARPTRAEAFTERLSVEVVNASFEGTGDPRLRELLASLVRHLHAFVKDVALTGREWAEAVEFLTAVGQTCDGVRQEMILLSDVLGLSMLVETINHRTGGTSTEATILGPFHMVDSPLRELGDNIAVDGKGEPCLVTGTITGPDGEPIAGASVDVWQANDDGFYDVQQPDVQPALNLRGLFRADSAGRFWFRTIVPRYYPIPADGPVGRLLHATRRHPNRPAHVHFVVDSPGYRKVTTHLFVANSPYIDSDAVFGVKDSLVRSFPLVDDSSRAAEFGLANPFRAVQFDVSLRAEDPPTETVSGSEKTS